MLIYNVFIIALAGLCITHATHAMEEGTLTERKRSSTIPFPETSAKDGCSALIQKIFAPIKPTTIQRISLPANTQMPTTTVAWLLMKEHGR